MDERFYSERLREIANHRIAEKEFTGSTLAAYCRISQAHLSNLLAGKRNFTLALFAAWLRFLNLEIEDLQDPSSLSRSTAFDLVQVVSQINAFASATITPAMSLRKGEVIIPPHVRDSSDLGGDRWQWTRFVAVRPTLGQIKFLDLQRSQKWLIVLDRHDRSVNLRATDRNDLHAVSGDRIMSIGCLREVDGQTMLLPRSDSVLPKIVRFPPNPKATHKIVGRVYGIWNVL